MTQKTKSSISGRARRKKPKLSYKKDFEDYGDIFSNQIQRKKSKLTAPPVLRARKASQKRAPRRRAARGPETKKAPRAQLEKEAPKRLKKEGSFGTSVSVNSSFSTAQNMGAFNNSHCENLRGPKRGVLTVEKERQQMLSKYSQKALARGPRAPPRNCDSDRAGPGDKELFLAEQPVARNYDTQKLIERIEYDKRYAKHSGRRRERRTPQKKKIALKQSFESDKETGFGAAPAKAKAGLEGCGKNTFSFNNLAQPKFNARQKPVLKPKRPSRLVSENKARPKPTNVFKDDEDDCQANAPGRGFGKGRAGGGNAVAD